MPSTEKGNENTCMTWVYDWRDVYRRLTRVGYYRGNAIPAVRQMCLVMKGEVGGDEGQMTVVTRTRRVMVEIV